MMYNRHRGLCSGEYANQYARPGSDLPLRPVPVPVARGSHRRNETVNTEGSRKSCTCIYIRTFRSALCRVHFRIASRLVNPFNVQAREKKKIPVHSRATGGTVRNVRSEGVRDSGCAENRNDLQKMHTLNLVTFTLFQFFSFYINRRFSFACNLRRYIRYS